MFFDWLLRSTCQVSVLICLVLLAQWALRRRLGVHGRYLLWSIVVLRMIMPWAPQSRLSVYNVLPIWAQPDYVYNHQTGRNLLTIEMSQEPPSVKANEHIALAGKGRAKTNSLPHTQSYKKRKISQWVMAALPLAWLAGALLLIIHILLHTIRIRHIIRNTPTSRDPELLKQLHACQREMGTDRPIRIVVSDKINSPGLFGILHTYLLLPSRILIEKETKTLRYILLHEMAHLKRWDIAVGIISSGFHVLHWFNPILGYAHKRMQADREIACDEIVLARLQPHEVGAYGRTIVGQLEQLLQTRTSPLTVGFLGGKTRIRQRIAAISHYKRETTSWSPLILLLILGLAWTGLTDVDTSRAQVQTLSSAPGQPNDDTAPLTETFTRTMQIHLRNLETDLYLVTDGQHVTCAAGHPDDNGLWEARFNDTLGHGGGVLLYSVAHDGYLSYDNQGDLTLYRRPPVKGSHWIVMARPQGTWIITEDINHNYLRVDEQTPVKADHMARDQFSYWDMAFAKTEVGYHVHWAINMDSSRDTKYHTYKTTMSKYDAVLKAQTHNPAAQEDIKRLGKAKIIQLIKEFGG